MNLMFKNNVYDGDQLIWKKAYLYVVLDDYVDDHGAPLYCVESEVGDTLIQKCSDDETYLEYECLHETCIVCNHCKHYKNETCDLEKGNILL